MEWTSRDGFLLNTALRNEMELTAYWYERMSGLAVWMPGEKDRVARYSDELARRINQLLAKKEVANGN